jgi:hypothetical protein
MLRIPQGWGGDGDWSVDGEWMEPQAQVGVGTGMDEGREVGGCAVYAIIWDHSYRIQ